MFSRRLDLPSTTASIRTFTTRSPRILLKPAGSLLLANPPSDAYQLLSTPEKAGALEDALCEQQVRDIETWWASRRFDGVKRLYSATDIVSKRESLQQVYPSSLMARKLFNLLNEQAMEGLPVHTSKFFG